MIKKSYLFPEFYIHKQAYCDDCNLPLKNTNTQWLTNPPMQVFVCEKCGKEYHVSIDELQGEWKWRTI